MPTVSVVIPTYRHRGFILQTLDSVFAQTFTDFEIIVVNDGSPDDTGDLLRPLVAAGRIRLIDQLNAGQGAARNRGIESATGEFLALLDDDDTWPSDHLQWQVAAMRQHPKAVMVYGTCQKSNQSVPDTPDDDNLTFANTASFAEGCPMISPGQALFRTQIVKRIGGLDPALWGTDDWDLYLRLAREGPVLVRNRVSLHYRVHEANASRNYWRMYQNGMRVVEKHFPAGHISRSARAAAVTSVRNMAAQIGIIQIVAMRRAGKRAAILPELARVIWIKPSLLLPGSLLRRSRHVLARAKN